MFGFSKRKPKRRTPKPDTIPQHLVEFDRRRRELYDKFAVEDTPYDELLDAMAAVEHELNHVGGGNWNEGNYDEYLEIIRRHLTSDPQFSPAQLKSIGCALDEIIACGDELERNGQSSRPVGESVDYLIVRVIDWCRTHVPRTGDDT